MPYISGTAHQRRRSGSSLDVSSFNAKDMLKDIQTPALVLHKRDDKIVPFEPADAGSRAAA